jgi:dolichol-phosphate mannosyltransferase
VGASGVVVNLGCLYLFLAAEIQSNIASALAIEISIISNFLLNYSWTFGDRNRDGRSFLSRSARFHLVSLGGGILQLATFIALNAVWTSLYLPDSAITGSGLVERWITNPPDVGRWAYVSQLAGIAIATLWNYLCNFYWTWGDASDAT